MLEDKDVCVRRCREGYEFFKSLRQRKVDLEASKSAALAGLLRLPRLKGRLLRAELTSVPQIEGWQRFSSTFIAALCPGMPLTPPPRLAPAPQMKTFGNCVSTPQVPSLSAESANGNVSAP